MTDIQARLLEIADLDEVRYGALSDERPDIIKAADEIARLTADRVKLDNLRHNHDALRREHDEWKGAVESAAADRAKADALAEAAEEYRYAVARSLPERIASTGLIKLRREAAAKLKIALTAYQEGK